MNPLQHLLSSAVISTLFVFALHCASSTGNDCAAAVAWLVASVVLASIGFKFVAAVDKTLSEDC